MKFTVLVNTNQQNAYTAYQFCKALLENKHQLVQVFFYNEGVHNANRFNASAADEINLTTLWETLAQAHQIKLTVCVTSANRRGINTETIAPEFKIAGLGQLMEAIANSERFISFG